MATLFGTRLHHSEEDTSELPQQSRISAGMELINHSILPCRRCKRIIMMVDTDSIPRVK